MFIGQVLMDPKLEWFILKSSIFLIIGEMGVLRSLKLSEMLSFL